MRKLKILFATSEAFPLIKTGGLADVSGSLPRALRNLGHEIVMVLPAYRGVFDKLARRRQLLSFAVNGAAVSVWQSMLPGTRVKLWLVDCPRYFDRHGGPYQDTQHNDWPDNAQRFALFDRVVERIAMNALGLHWKPDVVHCHDWQTGLVPAMLHSYADRPACIFTIHNLAYQGLFPYEVFEQLNLPREMWHYEKLEFYNQFSFLKGGLVYADRINTVSPNYAEEIKTRRFGCGLEHVLQHRRDRLSGILNGIDTRYWDPAHDDYLVTTYNRKSLEKKADNKLALQEYFNLPGDKKIILYGLVSRLAQQKGVDLLLGSISRMQQDKVSMQVVILGSGETRLESRVRAMARKYPHIVAAHIGYDEPLAHLVEAGIDAFVMPSRYEPCGLNQMYSQRYGTLPIVSPVGGLYDTVVNADMPAMKQRRATGFVMNSVSVTGLYKSMLHAHVSYADQTLWTQMQKTAMQQDFSWKRSAEAYLQLYQQAIQDCQVSQAPSSKPVIKAETKA